MDILRFRKVISKILFGKVMDKWKINSNLVGAWCMMECFIWKLNRFVVKISR